MLLHRDFWGVSLIFFSFFLSFFPLFFGAGGQDNLKRRRQEALEKRLNKIRKRKGQAPLASAATDIPADVPGEAPPETTLPTALGTDEADEKIDDFLSFYKNKSRLPDA